MVTGPCQAGFARTHYYIYLRGESIVIFDIHTREAPGRITKAATLQRSVWCDTEAQITSKSLQQAIAALGIVLQREAILPFAGDVLTLSQV
jgi:hypothetical protein